MKLLHNQRKENPSTLEDDPQEKRHSEMAEYRVRSRALAKIQKAGLPKPEPYMRNGEPINPKIDLKLASIDNAALGKLMAEFTASCEYAAYAAAVADIDRTIEKNILEFVEAKVRLSKSGTVQRKADKTNVDPHVIAARQAFLEKDAIATLTATLLRSYERSLQTISREITRRQNELEYRQT
jgi:hypothetical protein